MSKRITIKDVAEDTGLSIAAVSYVLNDKDGVRPETRELVLSAVERLGYVPNYTARGLASHKSRLIGVCSPQTEPGSKLMFDNPVNLLSHIKAGTLVALGQTGASRMAALSDVPTMVEAGVPGFNATPWYGLMAPRGVPPAVAQKVNQEINAFLQQPAVVDKLADLGMTTRRMSVPEMEAFLQVEGKKWSAAASSTNKN